MKLWRHVRAFVICLKALGLRGALQWTVYRAWDRLGLFPLQSFKVRPRKFVHPLEMRAGSSSDHEVFRQVFIMEEYKSILSTNPAYIIDLGANIGLSSAWFLSRFPQSIVLAVEPDPDNYLLCCRNVTSYGNRVRVLHGAAWSKRTMLSIVRGSFRDGREWTSQVMEPTGQDTRSDVEGWDVDSLLKLSGAKVVDLLKIDVEMAELEIFAADCEKWLSSVRTVCIELHGKECEEVFFNALKNHDFELSHDGELTICSNLRQKMVTSRASRV